VIRDLRDLAEAVGASEPTEASVRHRLYKDTDCGIGFAVVDGGKTASFVGYCEGSDRDCAPRRLAFPFTETALREAISGANADGCEEWDATHGCDACNTFEVEGAKPVDPDCAACGGAGIVI